MNFLEFYSVFHQIGQGRVSYFNGLFIIFQEVLKTRLFIDFEHPDHFSDSLVVMGFAGLFEQTDKVIDFRELFNPALVDQILSFVTSSQRQDLLL